MTFWAKLFIIIVLVLSVAFAGMSAVVFARRAAYRKDFAALNELYEKYQVKAKSAIDELAGKLVKASDALNQKNIENENQKKAIAQKDAELDQLKNDAVTLNRRLGEATSAQEKASDAEKVATTLNIQLNKDNQQLAKLNQAQEANIVALNGKVDGLNKDKENLTNERDALKVSLADATEVIKRDKDIFSQLTTRGYDVGEIIRSLTAVPQIDAKVMTVSKDGIVILNKGNAQGVAKGYQFTIWRGDSYVATVDVVNNDDKNMCAARVKTQKLPILVGDNASTRLR